MQIFVRNLEGRTLPLSVEADASVEDVKQLIEATEGIPTDVQVLTLAGKLLSEDSLFADAVIQLTAGLDGAGKKKKKKKVYKTPKKIPHKKKKVVCAVLKYYKVSEDSVTTMRKTCVTCGPGVFMAKHADRLHCGKCSYTQKLA